VKFASFRHAGNAGWGAVVGNCVRSLPAVAPTLREAIARGKLPRTEQEIPRAAPAVPLDNLPLLPPIPDTARIFCVGLNYADHQAETGRKPTEHPVIFMRYAQSVLGHGAALLAPPESETYDFEGELAVIVGKAGRRIAEADALSHVAGYSCFMDGTIRAFQLHTHQYTPGKNFDRSGAFGPWLVTPDEAGDPKAGMKLETRLNGQVVQQSSTNLMLFPVPVVIAYLSSFTALEPGDVIATGTPAGVGFKRIPPLYMRGGDRIEVEIERVGLLANRIEQEPA
jgi:2-keto-4-pentenoate hydratase/2-oxohepta-3-ene-1,7-dioic acid hydratase in catechol pathway